jgi:pimeloyl-ACP methyl ester carboxylesterase
MKRKFFLTTLVSGLTFSMGLSQSPKGRLTPDLHQTALTRFIEVDGVSYAYRAFGKKTGIPVVLLQHFTGTMDNWDPAVTNGLAEYFPVVLFDNKGIAASGGQTPFTIEEMAKDAVGFIKAMGFKKVNLLGFSMGGFISQQIALDEPALVNKLMLVGTGPKGGQGIADVKNPLSASASMTRDQQKLYLFYESTSTSQALGKGALERINKRSANRDPDASESAIQAQLQSIMNWGDADPAALKQLKNIYHPVLVINGSNDIVVPTINSYVLFQHLPNAKLSLYPDSGHGALFQYPGLFLREAILFLKE